jgi:NitT/TauT family transport system substrate-binding protein
LAVARGLLAITAIVLVGLVAACGSSSSASTGGSDAASGGSSGTEVRLGFFPNVNHAPALIGAQEGTFAAALKPLGATVKPTLFNAGPEAVTALFSDSLDIAYIGPNPTVNAFVESKGEAVRVIAGAASGGATLVVKPGSTAAQTGQDTGDTRLKHPGVRAYAHSRNRHQQGRRR